MQDYIGERYSVVYFSIAGYNEVPLDQRAQLQHYPTDDVILELTRMLAPPRGYCDGKRQKSILEAFNLVDKKQALCWPMAATLGKMPEEVLRLMMKLAPMLALANKRLMSLSKNP